MICIYKIVNLVNGHFYVGSTKNFKKRKVRHLRDLNRGEHHSIYLQRAYNKYGVDNFKFEVIEECSVASLFDREEYWTKQLLPEYNIGSICGGDNYTNHPDKELIKKKIVKNLEKAWENPTRLPRDKNPNWRGGKTFFVCPICNKEIRISSGQSPKTCGDCVDRSGTNNNFFGKSHSEETKEKIRLAKLGSKPPNMKRCIIDGVEYESCADAAKKLGIKRATLSHRLRSKTFTNYYYIGE